MLVNPTHVDNLFSDPDAIVDYANSLQYHKGKNNYPGKRSDLLEQINPELVNYLRMHVLAQFYDINQFSNILIGGSETTFQKIPYSSYDGLVHTDSNSITVIAYLDKYSIGHGTSVMKSKLYFPNFDAEEKKIQYFSNNLSEEDYINEVKKHNDQFYETVKFNGEYNTMSIINGRDYHKANLAYNNREGERLTLTSFIYDIVSPDSPIERTMRVK